MKIKLNPEIALFLGFWKMRKTPTGIGVFGDKEIQEKFVQKALTLLKIPPEKIKVTNNSVSFRHIKYENVFKKIIENETDFFNRKNKITSFFLKGIYESAGHGNIIWNATFQDRMLIERLGFYTKKKGRDIIIINFSDFLSFINKFG